MDILAGMTRIQKRPVAPPAPHPRPWMLQEANARFSELVRRARGEGPQHVTVHGRDGVVVMSEADLRRFRGGAPGQVLIDALQASPCRDVEIAPDRAAMPVRAVIL